MFKKLFLIIALAVALTINVSAAEIYNNIKPDGEFYVYGEKTEKIAELLDMMPDEVEEYFTENSVEYFAVSSDNKKQIKLSCSTTDFSNSVINISNLSNDSIMSLIPDIAGIEGLKGDIVEKQGQKFIKIQLKGEDSGGEYILTEYITIAQRKQLTLSFYTQYGADTEYIENTFNSFSSPMFIAEEEKAPVTGYVMLIAGIIFGIICVIIVITIFKDIKKEKSEVIQEDTENNDN